MNFYIDMWVIFHPRRRFKLSNRALYEEHFEPCTDQRGIQRIKNLFSAVATAAAAAASAVAE